MLWNNPTAIISLSAIALIGAGTLASAQVLSPGSDTFAEVGAEGPWKIYADAQRQSCLIEGMDANGNVVQMGLTADHSLGYVGVFTQAPVELAQSAEITIEVNGNAYSGTAQMREHGLADGYTGGYFVANNPDFVQDMRAGTTMIAFANATGEGVAVDLAGSAAAIDAAAACTAQLGG